MWQDFNLQFKQYTFRQNVMRFYGATEIIHKQGETEGNLPTQIWRLLHLEITWPYAIRLLWGTVVPGTDAF